MFNSSVYHKDDYQYSVKIKDFFYAKIPTAEEMIGWLEEQLPLGIDISVEGDMTGHWNYFIGIVDGNQRFDSRKEATLAAIDAAFNYLDNDDLTK